MYQKKKDKRTIQSCEWIYDSLKELMNEKSYDKITVIDIVEKAKIGRTTFYRNFKSIDDVLIMKCEEKFEEFRLYCFDYFKNNSYADKTFLKPFLNFWYMNSEIIELLMKANRENILRNFLHDELYQFINISSISENKVISNHVNYFIEMRVSNSMSILTEWIRNDKNILPDDLADIIIAQVNESINHNLLF